MIRILFLDDDLSYQNSLTEILTHEGYQVTAVSSAMEAIEIFTLNQNFDLVISDLKMDELDGIKFLTYIKRIDKYKKTIILTADPTMDTELEALNIFVDKYISKDTRLDVLLRHIQNLIATQNKEPASILLSKLENIQMDVRGLKVMKNNEPVSLTLKEFNILRFLLEHKGVALKREEFIEEIWNAEYENVDSRIIDVHIKELRKKLQIQCIVTIRGFGYKWDE